MSLTLPNGTRSAICDAIVDLVDAGAGAGKLKIKQSTTLLAEITLSDPAYSAATNGVATLAGTPLEDSSADATGTADNYELTDSDDAIVMSGAIGSPTCVLSTAARNAAIDALCDPVDAGSPVPGYIELRSAGAVVLAVVTLEDPAFGTAANGARALFGGDGTNPISDSNPLTTVGLEAAGFGTECTNFKVFDGNDVEIFSGTVTETGGGGDLTLDNAVIAEGQDGAITAFTATQPANGTGGVVLVNNSINSGQSVEVSSGSFTVPGS